MKSKKIDKGKSVATQPPIQQSGRPPEESNNAAETSQVSERAARLQARSEKLRRNNDASEGDKPSGVASTSSRIPRPSPARSEQLQRGDNASEDDESSDQASIPITRKNPTSHNVERDSEAESVRAIRSRSSRASSRRSHIRRSETTELGTLLQQLIATTRATASDIAVSMETNSRRTEEAIRVAFEHTNAAIQAASERTENAIQAALNRSDAINQASLQAIFDRVNGRTGINTTAEPTHSPATTSIVGDKEFATPSDEKTREATEHLNPTPTPPTPSYPGPSNPRPSRAPNPFSTRNPHEVPSRDPPRNPPSGGGGSNGGGRRRGRGHGAGDGGGEPPDDEDNPGNTGQSQPDSRFGDPESAPNPQSNFNWEQIGLSSWERRASREYTPSEIGVPERHSSFRGRIRRGIIDAVRNVILREPFHEGSNTFIKSVAAITPVPIYSGEDDLEVFMTWLQNFLTFIDMHQLVGERNEHNRVTTTRSALEGPAQIWFDTTIRPSRPGGYREMFKFIDVMLRLSDAFITPAAATRSQQSFERVTYNSEKGIRAYVRELQIISYHLLMPVDEYTSRRRIIEAIHWRIRNHLIDFKGLSTSTSSVVEWVDAIERRERELLERSAYDTVVRQRVRTSTALKATSTSRDETPTKTQPRTQSTRTTDRARPVGQTIPSRQRLTLSEITCYACGMKGHYKGSKECPKTPTSARLHAIGVKAAEEDDEELITPEVEIEVEEPFEGEDYDGNPDVELAQEDEEDDYGVGAIVANIHVVDSDSDNDDDKVVHLAAVTTSSVKDDRAIADELLRSVKTQYEERGSGMKIPIRGPSAKQLKVDSQKVWASNPNIKNPKDPTSSKILRRGRCLTAIVNVNGVDAFMCWDTGSELDAISPDFIRATGLRPKTKENPIKIRLGTKGSSSMTSYEVNAELNFGKTKLIKHLDVVNLDRWDVILGATFCDEHKVVLDFGNRTVRIGDTIVHALSKDEETAVRKGDRPSQHSEIKTRIAAMADGA
jgi:hypothetical protein